MKTPFLKQLGVCAEPQVPPLGLKPSVGTTTLAETKSEWRMAKGEKLLRLRLKTDG
jgi:hypothetical protein